MVKQKLKSETSPKEKTSSFINETTTTTNGRHLYLKLEQQITSGLKLELQSTSSIEDRRSVRSDQRSITFGLNSFLTSTCCPTAPPLSPLYSLKVFHLYTLILSFFLSYIFGLMGLLWFETLCLSVSLSI